MHSQADIINVATSLLQSHGFQLVNCRILQTLWAGYGHICSLEASPTGQRTEKTVPFILKFISPPPIKPGKHQDEGHIRKMISYQVEQQFYAHLAPKLPKDIAVASCLASIDSRNSLSSSNNSTTDTTTTAMILSDLRVNFPLSGEKRGALNARQVNAAIDWLAGFHGFWWTNMHEISRRRLRRPPLVEVQRQRSSGDNAAAAAADDDGDGKLDRGGAVWLNGGYTYLATRRSEYLELCEEEDDDGTSEWASKLCRPLNSSSGDDNDNNNNKSLAELVAKFLSPSADIDQTKSPSSMSPYETLIHGDVKSENLFTTSTGDNVAFFDFQYVGLGLGVCDLAKLFTCSLPETMLREAVGDDDDGGAMHPKEETLLRRYVTRLEKVSGKPYEWDVFVRHWETALVDWLRFQASWGFWGNTGWLEARVRHILRSQGWKDWLDGELSRSS